MSAIVGIYYRDGRPVAHSDLERMVESVAHRGPDGSDAWSDGPVGLGHQMLRTTPESLHERLPFANRTGDLAITADARIDNRDELIGQLCLDERPSGETTDSQLILAAYEKWGERCPEKLLGDFAFAIWDGRKQALFCARDHFGVKPFYYYSSGQAFVFATEIKALLCLPEVPRRLNEVMVADHLTSACDDVASTFYQDVLRLPPAHSMMVNRERTQLRSYWSLDPSRELRLGSDEEYAEGLRELFTEAVNCRLRSAYPVGSTLSGGLDSSSITCVARKLLAERGDQRLHTFSLVFDEVTECQERQYIDAVLAQGGLEPHFVHGDQVGPLTDIDRVHWHTDEALFGGNTFLVWALNTAANRQGIRVLLDGFDGDSTISHGTGYFIELALSDRWLAFAEEARGYTRHFGVSPWKLLQWYAWHYRIEPVVSRYQALRLSVRIWRGLLRRARYLRNPPPRPIINSHFIQNISLAERPQAARKTWSGRPRTEREAHYRRLAWGVQADILEVNDNAAAAFSLEKRYPFWDKRLVEFCLALPPEQKLQQGWIRMVQRRAMAGILPKEVQWRGGKTDMSPNFEHGLIAFERELLEEAILQNPTVIEKYVDVSALRETYQRFASREAKEDDVIPMWRAVTLALWLQRAGLTT